jgi:tRNA A37 threonylcarbamoyladenosine modification protein TsaB
VATDARRKELYWARYSGTGERLEGPSVGHPDQLPALPVVGPGAGLYPGLDVADGPRALDPGVLAVRGPRLPDAGSTPLYLRRPDAAVPTRRKSVLVRRPERAGLRP